MPRRLGIAFLTWSAPARLSLLLAVTLSSTTTQRRRDKNVYRHSYHCSWIHESSWLFRVICTSFSQCKSIWNSEQRYAAAVKKGFHGCLKWALLKMKETAAAEDCWRQKRRIPLCHYFISIHVMLYSLHWEKGASYLWL